MIGLYRDACFKIQPKQPIFSFQIKKTDWTCLWCRWVKTGSGFKCSLVQSAEPVNMLPLRPEAVAMSHIPQHLFEPERVWNDLEVAERIPHFRSHSQAFFSLIDCEAFTVPITDAHETCGFTWLLQTELYLHLLNGKWKFIMRTFGKWAWEITRRKTSSENSSNLQSMNVFS